MKNIKKGEFQKNGFLIFSNIEKDHQATSRTSTANLSKPSNIDIETSRNA